MFTRSHARVAVAAVLALAASTAGAQQPAASGNPDFALPGATRYGLLRDSVRLSDFRGKTVVLGFFYKARTKG